MQVDVARRMVTVQGEAKRLMATTQGSLDANAKSAALAEQYLAVMQPPIVALQRRMHATLGREAETPHEAAFAKDFLRPLGEAIKAFEEPARGFDYTHPESAWRPLRKLAKAVQQHLR